ncbi:MAG: nuclear transport factor 2 family protein, partial [Solirubrobacterales bacterium]
MSENSDAVERFIAAFNAGDLDAFVETLDPEVEILSDRGMKKGAEDARVWATRAPGGVQQHVVIDELRESGDFVVALTRRQWFWDGTDELANEDEMAHVFTLRNGKVMRWQPFEQRAEAL